MEEIMSDNGKFYVNEDYAWSEMVEVGDFVF